MKTLIIIISRILFFPYILGVALTACAILFCKYMINYIRFGGEAIVYTHKNERKTINDIYMKLSENENQTNKKEMENC